MPTRYLLYLAALWALIGLIVAFVMRRRGHNLGLWMLLGVVLGPFSIPLAIERVRFHSEERKQSSPTSMPPRTGFDLLVGIDGSDESQAALSRALDLFGWQLSGITLATVLDYDLEHPPEAEVERSEALDMLEKIAANLDFEPVDARLLYGRADVALIDHARAAGMELIVVGAKGRGATEALFGSVTSRLVGGSEVPVFVGPKTG